MTFDRHTSRRAPSTPSVACLLAAPDDARALAACLPPRADCRAFEDRRALMAHVRAAPVAAVVVDLRDVAGRPTSGTVRALRGIAPRLPVLARCRLAEHDCRALLDFARAGGTDVLVGDGDCAALRAALDRGGPGGAPAPTHAALVARVIDAGVPPRFAPLLDYAFAHLDDPDAPARAHEALGVGRRALERRLARAALPSPRTLHSWCRLLAAADRLRGDAVAIERIAHDVGFPSANALRNALQRHGATTPTALRADDGLQALIERLCARSHATAAQPRVAEGCACDVRAALAARARLVDAVAGALAFAPRERCRARCASTRGRRGIVSPRLGHRTSAVTHDGVQRDTHHDGRET